VGSSRKNSAGSASSSDAIEARLRYAAGQLTDRDQRTAGQFQRPQHGIDRAAWHAAQRCGVAERAGERQGEMDDVVLRYVADVP
jgi:hypothetical protein